jgi:hypothetical protein
MSIQKTVRDVAIRALDQAVDRIGQDGEKVVHRLAREWRSLSDREKRELMETLVAVGGAAVVAVSAMREKKKKPTAKKLVREAGSKVLKAAGASAEKALKKAKKK